MKSVKLPPDLTYYFALYLYKKEKDKDNESMTLVKLKQRTCRFLKLKGLLYFFQVVRQLQDFEAPYISLKAAQKSGVDHRIVVRKG